MTIFQVTLVGKESEFFKVLAEVLKSWGFEVKSNCNPSAIPESDVIIVEDRIGTEKLFKKIASKTKNNARVFLVTDNPLENIQPSHLGVEDITLAPYKISAFSRLLCQDQYQQSPA